MYEVDQSADESHHFMDSNEFLARAWAFAFVAEVTGQSLDI
jgi:hypothetical protein